MSERTIAEWSRQSYENSAAHGFWDDPDTDATIPMKLALIHSEVSEALESYRDPASDEMVKVPADLIAVLMGDALPESSVFYADDRMTAMETLEALYRKWQSKPKGFDIELADALIRIFDLAGKMNIDLTAALETKAAYNQGREFKHGRRV